MEFRLKAIEVLDGIFKRVLKCFCLVVLPSIVFETTKSKDDSQHLSYRMRVECSSLIFHMFHFRMSTALSIQRMLCIVASNCCRQ